MFLQSLAYTWCDGALLIKSHDRSGRKGRPIRRVAIDSRVPSLKERKEALLPIMSEAKRD
jgi:hypothetical protein